jgi:hypothetical protein
MHVNSTHSKSKKDKLKGSKSKTLKKNKNSETDPDEEETEPDQQETDPDEQETEPDQQETINKIKTINYLVYNISTEQNNDDNYIEKGIITLFDTQGLNLFRRNISKIQSSFGGVGMNTYIYNYCVNSLLQKVKDEMEKQGIDKISNAKIKFILPQKLKTIKVREEYIKPVRQIMHDINVHGINIAGGSRILEDYTNVFVGNDIDGHTSHSWVLSKLTILTRINIFFIGTALQKK